MTAHGPRHDLSVSDSSRKELIAASGARVELPHEAAAGRFLGIPGGHAIGVRRWPRCPGNALSAGAPG